MAIKHMEKILGHQENATFNHDEIDHTAGKVRAGI